MSKLLYVDVAMPKSKRKKNHVAYDPAIGKFIKTQTLTKLVEYGYSKIYIDTLLSENYDDILHLLKNNVKIYLLKDAKLLKKLRLDNIIRKTDENDAMLLSLIPQELFREVEIREIEQKKKMETTISLLEEYVIISNLHQRLRQACKKTKRIRPEIIKEIEKEKTKLSRLIHKTACQDIPLYKLASEKLGFSGTNLAGLIIYVDFSRNINKIKAFLGLTNNNRRNYNHKARRYLSRLAINIYSKTRQGTGKYPEKYKKLLEEYDGKIRKIYYKLQCLIIEDLRRLWRLAHSSKDCPADEW